MDSLTLFTEKSHFIIFLDVVKEITCYLVFQMKIVNNIIFLCFLRSSTFIVSTIVRQDAVGMKAQQIISKILVFIQTETIVVVRRESSWLNATLILLMKLYFCKTLSTNSHVALNLQTHETTIFVWMGYSSSSEILIQ